jgi:putative transposase
MGLCAFQKNTIVRISGAEYTLLRQATDTLWQLEDTKSKRIVELEHDQILHHIAEGTLTFPGSKIAESRRPTSTIKGSDLEQAKVRRAYVQAVLKDANTKLAMQDAVDALWQRLKVPEKPPSYSTIQRWVSRYRQGRQDIALLCDNTAAKGNRAERYPCEVLELCRQSIDNKYLKSERDTVQTTLQDAIHHVDKENQLRPTELALKLPTRRLIKRLIHEIPAYDIYAARFGADAARREFRSVMGHTISERPLDRAEIDHTILDLLVLDDETCLPLGRPYITLCIDHYSRCILGLFISFTPPSYMSVAECLKDCFRPKVWLKTAFPEIKNDWLAFGVMSTLVLDNGLEFHSESLQQACYSLGIEMNYAPRRQGWFKGTIERVIGTMNRAVAHGTPGTSFANIMDKGDYDPAKHAVITLSRLQTIVRKWIVDVYHQQPHRTIQTSPADKWKSSIRLEDIPLPDESTNFDVVMGRVGDKVLTHRGIEHEGLFYNSKELTELRLREGPKLKVEIRANDSDIGHIYVLNPSTSASYSVPALRQDYAKGLSLWQHNVIKRWQARDPNLGTGPDGWLQAKEDIAQLIEQDFQTKRRKTRKRVARFKEDTKRNQHQATGNNTESEWIPSAPLALADSSSTDLASAASMPEASVLAEDIPDECPKNIRESYPQFGAIYKEIRTNE